jgi:hypothetical protein
MLDAIGADWALVESTLSARAELSERLIVVTDQPMMHLAHRIRRTIEFVSTSGPPDAAYIRRRLDEIERVYAVEQVIRVDDSGPVR